MRADARKATNLVVYGINRAQLTTFTSSGEYFFQRLQASPSFPKTWQAISRATASLDFNKGATSAATVCPFALEGGAGSPNNDRDDVCSHIGLPVQLKHR